MGSQPLVSVCIPAYNNEHFIGFTLQSVLNQTYSNFEIIVTDDASTDGTVSVVKSFSDSRIRLVRNQVNLGMGGNWNKALSCAGGKYVKLLCADDAVYPDCFCRQAEILEDPSNARVVLAICNSNVMDADNKIILRRKSRFRPGPISGKKLIRNCVRWGTNRIGEPVVGLFKRDVLPKSGMFDPRNPYLIDLVFWAALLKHGDAFIDERRLAAFRISAGAVSTRVGLRQAAYFRCFIRQIQMDPVYRASRLDVLMGSFLSFQWCILRNLLINLRAGKKGRNN